MIEGVAVGWEEVAVRVAVGVPVCTIPVCVAVGDIVAVPVRVGEGVIVRVSVGVGVLVAEAVAVGVAEGDARLNSISSLGRAVVKLYCDDDTRK